jgi:hypothetical protein
MPFIVNRTHANVRAIEKPLHARQIQGGGGFTLRSNIATMQEISGATEQPNKIRRSDAPQDES